MSYALELVAEANRSLCKRSTQLTVYSIKRCSLTAVEIDVVDSCPGWEPLLSMLTEAGNKTAAATVNFHHANAVEDYSALQSLFSTATLITLMFTLNEMVTAQGKVPTTKFLIALIKCLRPGALVLVSRSAVANLT